ncbi:MAG: hypothetical protein Q7W56_11790 [Candidatus Latescibacteria bacterium]|nr:hypothetical protein [Candidatus Latescibacterota bacterium]
MWNVAFFMPAQRDVPLLVEATQRDDVRVLGVVAPDRAAPAAALAEVMGMAVWSDLAEAPFPRDTLLVELADAVAADGPLGQGLSDTAAARGWRRLGGDDFRGLLRPATAESLPTDAAAPDPLPDRRSEAEAFVRSLDRDLADLAGGAQDLPGILAAWTATLALRLDARHATLALLREDGSLLLAEGTPVGETRIEDADTGATPWREVFAGARQLVAVEQGVEDGWHLTAWPLTSLDEGPQASAPRAALAVGHAGAAAAARFQALGAILAPALGLRCELLRRQTEHAALAARFEVVAAAATAVAASPGDAVHDLAVAVRRCCGAIQVERRPAGADPLCAGIAPGQWLSFATPGQLPRLLLRAGDFCWDLHGKQRLHAWDAAHFTGDDAAAAGLLLAATNRGPVASPPIRSEPDPHPDVPPDLRNAQPPAAATGIPAADAPAVPEALLDLLAREMDRADRYHGAFSLSAFRAAANLAPHLSRLAARLRSSDRVFCHDPGTLLVFAPDENHAVAQLEQRVREALPDLAASAGLRVRSGRALYPGRFTSPSDLVAAALAALGADAHGD